MNNLDQWKDFLSPLRRRRPRRSGIEYEKNTIGSATSLSRDFALKLKQEVMVNKSELEAYETKLRAEFEQAKRTLFRQDSSEDEESNSIECADLNEPERKRARLPTDQNDDNHAIEDDYESTKDGLPVPHIQKSHTMPMTQLPSGYPGSIQSVTPKSTSLLRPNRIPDHRSTSLSKWRFDMFVRYFEFDKIVKKLTLDLTQADTKDIKTSTDIYHDVLSTFGGEQLSKCMQLESYVRVLLNGMLMDLCKQHGLRMYMEHQIKFTYIPTGKLDYLITTKDGCPLGCVETKHGGTFDSDAFAQAVLELLLVQELACKRGVDVLQTPVFCILTDGCRFVIMQLRGQELMLEHSNPEPGENARIHIHKIEQETDFVNVINTMSLLVSESISRNKEDRKDSNDMNKSDLYVSI